MYVTLIPILTLCTDVLSHISPEKWQPDIKLKNVVPPKQLQFTKKENATLQQHIEILNWYHWNGKNQSKTAKHFDAIYPNL
jgi:ubiquitin-protein ligase